MTTIYCKKRETNKIDFYMVTGETEYFLFSQKKSYYGVEKYFRQGVSLDDAINHKKGKSDHMINKTMTKLPIYIRYAIYSIAERILSSLTKNGVVLKSSSTFSIDEKACLIEDRYNYVTWGNSNKLSRYFKEVE